LYLANSDQSKLLPEGKEMKKEIREIFESTKDSIESKA
jgi:hypothetical protein